MSRLVSRGQDPNWVSATRTTKRREDVNKVENSKNVQLKGRSVKNTTIYPIATQRDGSYINMCKMNEALVYKE
jgi:hypothetical protein